MRYAIAVVFVIHGFAHLVGFVVPWRIATLDEAPYKTTLLDGRIDIGDHGIRLVGILWLTTAIAFWLSGAALLMSFAWWWIVTLCVTILSVVLCIFGLPESKLGIPINVLILAYLVAGKIVGWLPVLGG